MKCKDIIEKYINLDYFIFSILALLLSKMIVIAISWGWKNILRIKEIIGPIVKTEMVFSAFIN